MFLKDYSILNLWLLFPFPVILNQTLLPGPFGKGKNWNFDGGSGEIHKQRSETHGILVLLQYVKTMKK